ncbi:MAG: tRNA glutamyl-Q(34) synthetase GluQRS [Gemmataceae bacterium]
MLVGRLAPSPTGAQHVGNARTYLITWLSVRSRGGQIRLRIEDIDSPRTKKGATEQIFEDFRWLGLDWDGEPVVQTQRRQLYNAALETLKTTEHIYPCTCSRKDVEEAASAPHAGHEGPVYPGTCANRMSADAYTLDKPYSWRFRLGEDPIIRFTDGYRGQVSIRWEDFGGDFVIWKNDGTPAYQLAVVVDDADMAITEAIRGDDLIPSTPRQLMLYRTLGLTPPTFVHVPLVIGTDGRRLAKRHGDTRLSSLREAGVMSEALLGLLAWSCGWLPRIQEISAPELLPLFQLASIPREPFVLEPMLLEQIGYDVKSPR